MTSTYRKKLIEVALPLEAINVASAREKSIRHGHPSTLHLWWARRPLAACRAVLFASLVNDPEDDPMYGINEDVAFTERAKLFDLIEELVQWDNSNNPRVINAARLEIARSIAANKVADKELNDDTPLVANAPKLPDEQTKYLPESPPEYTPRDVRFKMPTLKPEQVNHFLVHYAPPVLDPFAGGGSIPLEAQRLGLRTYASDLNPVPVLINKALIEIPSKFADRRPVNPESHKGKLKNKQWTGAEGLAEDVRYFGEWIRREAEKRIGHLYPKVLVTQNMVDEGRPDLEPYVGQELTVIAWLWARTVESPNPAFQSKHVPLVRSYWLSKKKERLTWASPEIDRKNQTYRFRIRTGTPTQAEMDEIDNGTKIGRGCNFRCILSDQPITDTHVKEQGKLGRLGYRMWAMACEGRGNRVYLDPTAIDESLETKIELSETLLASVNAPIALDKRAIWCLIYGIDSFDKLFTKRQLFSASAISDLVIEVMESVRNDKTNISINGNEAGQYANAIGTYLAFALNRLLCQFTTICPWSANPAHELVVNMFARQGIPMTWDFGEINPFCGAASWEKCLDFVPKVLDKLTLRSAPGIVSHADASDEANPFALDACISTDPPYYDNIGYADLSDFFYIWLRRSLASSYPDNFSTLVTPKSNELIASPYRHEGGMEEAKHFFEGGLRCVFTKMRESNPSAYPATIYYAFKQIETKGDLNDSVVSTGWETMLQSLIDSKYEIRGTWPMRTERPTGVKASVNALASSIILVCRPRPDAALMVTRRDFANALRAELPGAIKRLQSGNVAPVDLAQASIGPGMAAFSRYSKVINADGSPMTVREALQLINHVLDESLVEQESDFDSETRFALKWFEQYGLGDGPYGDAENLSKAMAVSVKGIEDAGILLSKAGKVRLLKREELDPHWDPASDPRLTMWEVAQHLIRTLEADGESGTADLLRRIGSEKGDIARELAYRLYQTCERKSLAKEAGAYNALVVSWPEISRLSRQKSSTPKQSELELTD